MPPRIQRYTLRNRIGVGGMAEVWLADAKFRDGKERPVVVKKILGHLSDDPAYQAMFLDEARIAASLRHANIVELLDRGRMDDALFLTLEYVDGVDVAGMLRAGLAIHQAPPLEVALWITSEVLAALDYVHHLCDEAGVPMQLVHRDVGLGNVLLSKRGAVKITDFGIAKARDRIAHTSVGVIKGNALSMAPEQITGEAMDARTDIYATGMLLHSLLIGRHPLERFPISRIFRIHTEGLLPIPSSENPTVHPDLDALVRKATALSPRDRHQSARELRADVLSFAAREGLTLGARVLAEELESLASGAPPAPEKTVPHAEQEPSVVGRLGPLIADAIGNARDTDAQVFHTEQSAEVVPGEIPPEETSIRSRLETLARTRPPIPALDGGDDDGEVGPTARATGTLTLEGWTREDAEADTDVNLFPDEILDEDTTSEAALPEPRPLERTSTLDDGELPRVIGRELVIEVTAKFRTRLVGHRLAVTAIAGADRADLLATASSDGNVVLWDLDAAVPQRTLRGHSAPATTLSATDDGALLLSGARDGTLRLWHPHTGEALRTLRGHGRWISAARIAPDGHLAVSVGDDRTLRIWDLDEDVPRKTIADAHSDFASSVALVPGTELALTGSFDRTLKLWDLGDGKVVRTLRGTERVRAVAVAPSGLHALAGLADGSLALWDLTGGEELARIAGHRDAVTSVAFVGERVAISAGFDGAVRMWDIPARRELLALDAREREPVLAGAFSRGRLHAASGTALLIWDVAGLALP